MTYKPTKKRVYYSEKKGRIVEREGRSLRIFWNQTMLDYLRSHYATTKNEELSEWLGVSIRTIRRKARELGLEKDRQWLTGVWDEHRTVAHIVHRLKGRPGCFKKGDHPNPDGEFKPGHKLSAESLKKQSESLKKWYQRNAKKASAKAQKAWETRRRKSANV
jgi:hypothetical protein